MLEVLGDVTEAHTEAAYELGGDARRPPDGLSRPHRLGRLWSVQAREVTCALTPYGSRPSPHWRQSRWSSAPAATRTTGTSTPASWTRSRRRSWAPAAPSTPEDVALPSNATKVVDCSKEHTAETFAVGDLPPELEDAEYDVAGAGGVRLPDLLREVPGVPRRRREHGDAHHRELGVVPALREGVGARARGGTAATSSAAARRARTTPRSRPRRPGCWRSSPPTTSGWSASTGRRCRARRRSRAARSTTGARSPRSRSATPRTPTPATGWSR